MKFLLQALCDDGEAFDTPLTLTLPSGKALTFAPDAGVHIVDAAELGAGKAKAKAKKPAK